MIRQLVQLLAGHAQGVWLLNNASPSITYIQEAGDDMFDDDIRQLDLGTGRIIVIRLPEVDTTEPTGLTTLLTTPGYCRICGCSTNNACTDEDDEPCYWVEADLCSVCADGAS